MNTIKQYNTTEAAAYIKATYGLDVLVEIEGTEDGVWNAETTIESAMAMAVAELRDGKKTTITLVTPDEEPYLTVTVRMYEIRDTYNDSGDYRVVETGLTHDEAMRWLASTSVSMLADCFANAEPDETKAQIQACCDIAMSEYSVEEI